MANRQQIAEQCSLPLVWQSREPTHCSMKILRGTAPSEGRQHLALGRAGGGQQAGELALREDVAKAPEAERRLAAGVELLMAGGHDHGAHRDLLVPRRARPGRRRPTGRRARTSRSREQTAQARQRSRLGDGLLGVVAGRDLAPVGAAAPGRRPASWARAGRRSTRGELLVASGARCPARRPRPAAASRRAGGCGWRRRRGGRRRPPRSR